MKILHLNAGNEIGGGMYHIISLLKEFNREEFILGVLEKGELLKRANDIGIKTVDFSNHLKISIPLLQEIANYIKREDIRYVHTHGPRANVYTKILKKLVPFTWIVTVHSDPTNDFMEKGMYGTFLYRLHLNALKNADRIILIADSFRDKFNEIGVDNKKIVTVSNGIDFQKKETSPYLKGDLGFTENDMLFLMVARLEHVKGHHIALEAFSELVSRNKKCHMLLAGEGALLESLKNMARELGIVHHVHFLGHRNDVERFYEMADITLLTSFSESFPLVLLESARASTPVIATNVGSVGELIRDKSLGWIISPGSVKELIDAMKEAIILRDEGMLQVMGKNLHLYASTRFSLEIFAENVYNVYLSMENVTIESQN